MQYWTQSILYKLTKKSSYVVIEISVVLHQIGRIKFGEFQQIVRRHQTNDGRSKGEVVPLVQPLIPHVDCREVQEVVTWLNVVHGGCHHSVQVVVGQKMFKEN